tara:strand:- start:7 stop:237 length:231 start_codon:yes stop_codon:yes gene_type:complete
MNDDAMMIEKYPPIGSLLFQEGTNNIFIYVGFKKQHKGFLNCYWKICIKSFNSDVIGKTYLFSGCGNHKKIIEPPS